MTQYIQYLEGNMHSEPYSAKYDDEDDDDFDDDEDGYEGLTDYEDEDESNHHERPRGTSVDMNGSLGNEYRRQRTESEGSVTQLDMGDDNRRDHHNQLERKRRASIKISYNELREAIPSLRDSKASRAVILQRAVEFIEELLKLKRDHTYCVDALRRQNDAVDSRVQAMQHLIQCIESEEALAAAPVTASSNATSSTNTTSLVSSSGGGTPVATVGTTTTLRLVSGSLSTSASGMALNTTGLPVYRLLKQSQPTELTDHSRATTKSQASSGSTRCLSSTTVVSGAGAHHVQLLPRSTANPTPLHLMMAVPSSSSSTSSSSSSSPHLHTSAYPINGSSTSNNCVKHNLGTLSAAATLVANSSHSYPPNMPLEAVQSRSQRSSPCGPSSSASSSSSSSLSSVPSRQTSCTSSTTPTATTVGNTANDSNCDDDDDGDEEEEEDENEEEPPLVIETLAAARAYEDVPPVNCRTSFPSVVQSVTDNNRRSVATRLPTLLTISSSRSPVVVTRSTVRPIGLTTTGPVTVKRSVLTDSPKMVRRGREPASSPAPDASSNILKCRRLH